MKKYTSVFGLFAKSSAIRIILTLLTMAAVQGISFISALNKGTDAYNNGFVIAHYGASTQYSFHCRPLGYFDVRWNGK